LMKLEDTYQLHFRTDKFLKYKEEAHDFFASFAHEFG